MLALASCSGLPSMSSARRCGALLGEGCVLGVKKLRLPTTFLTFCVPRISDERFTFCAPPPSSNNIFCTTVHVLRRITDERSAFRVPDAGLRCISDERSPFFVFNVEFLSNGSHSRPHFRRTVTVFALPILTCYAFLTNGRHFRVRYDDFLTKGTHDLRCF